MRNKTFPKENESKLKDTIKKLRSERRELLKRVKFLEDELINLKKPIRSRKVEEPTLSDNDWRKQFYEKFKESLK